MKTKILDDGLIIEPETDFEADFLKRNFIGTLKAFLKRGMTPRDLIGLKVCKSVGDYRKIPHRDGINDDMPVTIQRRLDKKKF